VVAGVASVLTCNPSTLARSPGRARYSRTVKRLLLDNTPLGVVTVTVPVVAPAGTVAEIAAPVELTVNVADVR
jgi:hypothetical protein